MKAWDFIKAVTAPQVRHGGWESDWFCHCGFKHDIHFIPFGPSEFGRVCPKCGHRDKWVWRVFRREWDCGLMGLKFNRRIVYWTEQHCPIEAANRSEKRSERGDAGTRDE